MKMSERLPTFFLFFLSEPTHNNDPEECVSASAHFI